MLTFIPKYFPIIDFIRINKTIKVVIVIKTQNFRNLFNL